MRKYLSDYAVLFSIAGLIVLLDQISKYLVRLYLPYGQVLRPELEISQYVRIVHWSNTGAAFGMFQSLGGFFTVLAVLVSLAILYYYPQIPKEDWLFRLALGLQLGGALGNLVDRLFRGEVTDFLSVLNFPVFNIADASVSVGAVLMFFGLWQRDRQESREARRQAEEQALSIEGENTAPLSDEVSAE